MKKILIFILSFCNIALPVTYGSFTENYFVELDNDEACTKLCSERGRDYVKNSGNETLVSTKGIINRTKNGKFLEGIHQKSDCICTVTIQYKK